MAHKPYEFGVKVSVSTPLHRCRGGQFVAHVTALPGNPYDGHTLAAIVPAIESTIGAALDRIVTDAGYKGHNAPKDQRFKVYVAGQKRGAHGCHQARRPQTLSRGAHDRPPQERTPNEA